MGSSFEGFMNFRQRKIKALMLEKDITITDITKELRCGRVLVSSCIAGRVRSEVIREYLISKLGPEVEHLLPLSSRRSTARMRQRLAECPSLHNCADVQAVKAERSASKSRATR